MWQGFQDLGFLLPLIDSMCDDDPSSRPTAAQALEQLNRLIKEQSTSSLRTLIRGTPARPNLVQYSEWRIHTLQAKLIRRSPVHRIDMESQGRRRWLNPIGLAWKAAVLSDYWISFAEWLDKRYPDKSETDS